MSDGNLTFSAPTCSRCGTAASKKQTTAPAGALVARGNGEAVQWQAALCSRGTGSQPVAVISLGETLKLLLSMHLFLLGASGRCGNFEGNEVRLPSTPRYRRSVVPEIWHFNKCHYFVNSRKYFITSGYISVILGHFATVFNKKTLETHKMWTADVENLIKRKNCLLVIFCELKVASPLNMLARKTLLWNWMSPILIADGDSLPSRACHPDHTRKLYTDDSVVGFGSVHVVARDTSRIQDAPKPEEELAPETTPPCRYNIEFTFDSDVRCAITIHYFCTEDITANGIVWVSAVVSFCPFVTSIAIRLVLCQFKHSLCIGTIVWIF